MYVAHNAFYLACILRGCDMSTVFFIRIYEYEKKSINLRSASRRQLVVPRYRLSTYGRRAFAVAGPSVWNSLPDNLKDPLLLSVDSDSFKRSLKTFLFATYMQRIRGSTRMRYTNLLLLTYLLTQSFYGLILYLFDHNKILVVNCNF